MLMLHTEHRTNDCISRFRVEMNELLHICNKTCFKKIQASTFPKPPPTPPNSLCRRTPKVSTQYRLSLSNHMRYDRVVGEARSVLGLKFLLPLLYFRLHLNCSLQNTECILELFRCRDSVTNVQCGFLVYTVLSRKSDLLLQSLET